MDKNQKIAVAVIVVIALIAAWQLGKKPSVDQNENQNLEQVTSEPSKETSVSPKPTPTKASSASQGSVWEGRLEASDNAQKGNYKLVTSDHVIYIHTSRDYSALVGKDVKVSYEGTLESFSLGDITAK